jgi:hypothetical protein
LFNLSGASRAVDGGSRSTLTLTSQRGDKVVLYGESLFFHFINLIIPFLEPLAHMDNIIEG